MNCIANNEHIILSFKYSIKDKNHTLQYIQKTRGNHSKTIENLFNKFEELSRTTWKELRNKPHQVGYEMIPISQFKINLANIKEELNMSDDSKIIVIRFDNQNKRILGVKSQECDSILYIIGYDWDYTAYEH